MSPVASRTEDRAPLPDAPPPTPGERRVIEMAAHALRPRDTHRVVEAMCALGWLSKIR